MGIPNEPEDRRQLRHLIASHFFASFFIAIRGPSRTIAGLNSFHQKVILIAGGKDKGISYESLGPVINERVKLLLLCGATAGVIRQSVEQAANYNGLEILDVEDYQEAVSLADSHSREGDVVILSPASTSFDRFANFMDRGKTFKNIVNQLP